MVFNVTPSPTTLELVLFTSAAATYYYIIVEFLPIMYFSDF